MIVGLSLEKVKSKHRSVVVNDNKRRQISVAPIRDRIIHRFIYERLVTLFDGHFDYDVWSCRKDKGLHASTVRVNQLIIKHQSYIWKSDVKKFFDSVDQQTLYKLIKIKVLNRELLWVVAEVIFSFNTDSKVGIPIGNLTSQIFANIYLNELEKYLRHKIKPLAYLRYGDDFLVFAGSLPEIQIFQAQVTTFLKASLWLSINQKSSYICKPGKKLKFLGVIFENDKVTLNRRNWHRLQRRLNQENIGSYYGMLQKYGDNKMKKMFQWLIKENSR